MSVFYFLAKVVAPIHVFLYVYFQTEVLQLKCIQIEVNEFQPCELRI